MATTKTVKVKRGTTYGQALAAFGNPIRANYTFAGWNTMADGSGEERLPTDVVAQDETIYAQWSSIKYTVSYISNGGTGSMADQTVNQGDSVTLRLNTFTRSNYTFIGWATSPGGAVEYANGATISNVMGNIILYAVWSANDNIAISYTGSTFQAVADFAVASNLTITINYAHSGGNSSTTLSMLSGQITGSKTVSHTITSILSLSVTPDRDASYSYIVHAESTPVEYYSVSYDANGGSGTIPSQTVQSGESVIVRSNSFSRSGYVFIGWATSSSGNVEYQGGSTISNVTSNITLYAVWRQSNPINITFSGSTIYASADYAVSSVVTVSVQYTKSGGGLADTTVSILINQTNGSKTETNTIGNITSLSVSPQYDNDYYYSAQVGPA
jgi:uncharacterized repeat protein (TIGR02543 family)